MKDFRHKVIETLGKSVYHIQLEVATSYFANQPGFISTTEERAHLAWHAAAAFMAEMEKVYSEMEHLQESKKDRPEDETDKESLNYPATPTLS